MASTLPVEQVSEDGQQKVTGDSFIRPHLRKLSPYQPILPFEVNSFTYYIVFDNCLVLIICDVQLIS